MSIDIVVPTLGESVTEAVIAQWLKKPGDPVGKDEAVVELETDKVTLEIPAPIAGTMGEQRAAEGDAVEVGAVLGQITEGRAVARPDGGAKASPAKAAAEPQTAKAAKAAAPAGAPRAADVVAMPAAAKMMADNDLAPGSVAGSGKGGRILKEDVKAALESRTAAPAAETISIPAFERPESAPQPARDREERVRMTRLRQTIARRLKDAQNSAAMLTTFNEVDMSRLMAVRNTYKDRFQKKHGGTKLGFMSFFVKACVAALQDVPSVNASIDGDTLVYKNYYDIGVAVSTPQGLVVPVVRDCDQLGFAQIEAKIAELGLKGRDGKLTLPEMTGGTFTITNGGIFGSMLSTPILNPPQSGILGMHKIQDRPVAIGGKVEIRPMMYLALTYDHRIIDGREAVTFLVRVKEGIEDPERLLLEV